MSAPATATAPVPIVYSDEVEATYKLITGRCAEVLGGDMIKEKLAAGKTLTLYWGTAPTGRPHLGYFVPLSILADFLAAGVEVTVLMADSSKSSLEVVAHRVIYYSKIIKTALSSLGVPIDKLKFVTGSSYQTSSAYVMDIFKISAITSEHDAKKAGAEVVKQSESAPLSGLIYPLMQALDEEYLKVDIQFGGVDQRKIFTLAMDVLPKLGFQKRSHLMNGMVPGLMGGKMSASDPNSKIDMLDDPAIVKKKIKNAFCEPQNITENGLLAFMKAVVFPVSLMRPTSQFIHSDAPAGSLVSITRDEKYGGNIHFSSYQAMEDSFASGELFPADLKRGMTDSINLMLEPILKAYSEDEEWKAVDGLAYPKAPEPEKKVKEKKQSKKGPKPEGVPPKGGAPKTDAAVEEVTEGVADAKI